MEWENQEPRQQQEHEVEELLTQQQDQQGNGSGLYVKVMTDEQMEILRKQISVYATICEKLVEMHKSITAQQDLAGMRLGSLYCDPLMTSAGHKITARQRWTPTPVQLQILEQIFDQGNGTPSKQKIKDITDELTKHGQISETNVYNWFQNRRARSKRKQSVSAPNNAESEVETEVESPRDKKTKPENIQSLEMLASNSEGYFIESSDIGNDMRCLDPQANKGESAFRPEHDLRSPTDMGHLSPYRGFDQFIGKMEVPGSFSHYQPDEGYDIIS